MEALRGGNTRPRRRKPPVEESSDEESTTDGEASDTSETNTDTEPES